MTREEFSPVFHTVEMILSFPGIFFSSLLWFAVRKCTLHPNCRALIILWMVAQIIMNLSIINYSLIFMIFEREGPPEFIHFPGYRRYFIENSLRFYYVSCFFEFGISFERAVSLRKPQQYHVSSLSKEFVIGWSFTSIAYGSLVGHLITEGWHDASALICHSFGAGTPQCAFGTIFSNIVDVGAFGMNLLVYFVCKRRNSVCENTTLNGRYHVKEVYSVTRALLPVYCIGSVIPVVTITWLFHFGIVSYAWSELVCTLACVCSCGVTSALFMLFHSVIRGRVARIFKRDSAKAVVAQHPTAEETTSEYFRIINNMWE